MKQKTITFALCIVCLTAVLLSCPMYRMAGPEDYEKIFTKIDYGPLEWKDSYILSASNYLPQVQVWDSASGKLIKVYELFVKDDKKKFYADLWITGIAEFHGSIWICSATIGNHIARLDPASGKMSFIDLDCHPETVIAFNDTEGGKGALWIATYSARGIGCAIRRLDQSGTIVKKCNITTEDINIAGVERMHYREGKYQLLADSHKDLYPAKENKGVYWLVNLSADNGEYVQEIPYHAVFPPHFFRDNNIQPIPERFISSFKLTHQYTDAKNVYCRVNVVGDEICHSLLYKVHSLSPVKLEYTHIIYSKSDTRSMFNVVENDTNIFITGRILYDVPGEASFTGLEIGAYPIEGGGQLKRIRLARGNQLYQTTKAGKTWFCRDVYEQDEATLTWHFKTPPQIYMLEHATGKAYKYSHDGSRIELEPEN